MDKMWRREKKVSVVRLTFGRMVVGWLERLIVSLSSCLSLKVQSLLLNGSCRLCFECWKTGGRCSKCFGVVARCSFSVDSTNEVTLTRRVQATKNLCQARRHMSKKVNSSSEWLSA